MDKFEEFKEFCKDKEYLKQTVRDGKHTWQELYEIYDIYGPEDELFSDKKEETEESSQSENEGEKKEGLGSILNALNGFDPDKISDGLNGMKKILNILSEVTKPDEAPKLSKRKVSRPYQRNDD